MSGTQCIPIFAPFVFAPRPATITLSSMVSMTTFSHPFGWNPFLSSSPQAHMFGGNVPNMHIPVRGITVPPSPIGQSRPSLIDLCPPNGQYSSVSHVLMTNYMASGIPQPSLAPSIWAPPRKP